MRKPCTLSLAAHTALALVLTFACIILLPLLLSKDTLKGKPVNIWESPLFFWNPTPKRLLGSQIFTGSGTPGLANSSCITVFLQHHERGWSQRACVCLAGLCV